MLSDKICEQARLSKDPRFDGRFFTGVISTGIYCRPICPAPPPKSENVVYFPHASVAQQAGLRPCLRCHPESAPGSSLWRGSSDKVDQALCLINTGYLAENSLEQLSQILGCSSRHLRRLFIQQLGVPPHQIENTRRLLFAKQLLNDTSLSIYEIAFASGYDSQRQFNYAFQKSYQRTPSSIRKPTSGRQKIDDYIPMYLNYRPPYDWQSLLDFLAFRAVDGIEWVGKNRYLRSITLNADNIDEKENQTAILDISNQPEQHRLLVKIYVCGNQPVEVKNLFAIKRKLVRLLDTEALPVLLQQCFNKSTLFSPENKMNNFFNHFKRYPGIRIPGCWDPFELSVRAIIGQQISVKGATTITQRLVSRIGKPINFDCSFVQMHPQITEKIHAVFPEAKSLSKQNLENLGLTHRRIQTLQDFARAILKNQVNFSPLQNTENFVQDITQIKGIGPWTAQYIAMRALNDPNAYPQGDLVLENNLKNSFGELSKQQIAMLFDECQPWRAYAALLIWRQAVKLKGKNR